MNLKRIGGDEALREQVLDIVLRQEGVIKTYTVLAQMQQQSNGMVAPPTAYRALDFWAEHGVLHKVAAGICFSPSNFFTSFKLRSDWVFLPFLGINLQLYD